MSKEIKPGLWRMKNDRCAVVEFKSASTNTHPWIGYDKETREMLIWSNKGEAWSTGENEENLVEPWCDKPIVNWPALPDWAEYVAMNDNNVWLWFAVKPIVGRFHWYDGGMHGVIPKEFQPSFTGDWKASLVKRPAKTA